MKASSFFKKVQEVWFCGSGRWVPTWLAAANFESVGEDSDGNGNKLRIEKDVMG